MWSKRDHCAWLFLNELFVNLSLFVIFKKPQGDPSLVQAVSTSVQMGHVYYSASCAMESSSVSMAQMSPAAVEVSTTKTTGKLKMVSAELSKGKNTIIIC